MVRSVGLARLLHENACLQHSPMRTLMSQLVLKPYSSPFLGLCETPSTFSSASASGSAIAEEERLKSLADLRRKYEKQTSDLRKKYAADIQEKRLQREKIEEKQRKEIEEQKAIRAVVKKEKAAARAIEVAEEETEVQVIMLNNRVSAGQLRSFSRAVGSRVSAGQLRSFSRAVGSEGLESLEQETERKAGWMLKAFAAITFTYVGFNVFPLMGDSLVKHSVALLRTKDPLFRRSGASRLTLIATDDERRMKIVDAGGVGELVNMLHSASDDDTRREAAKALATISQCDAAVEALHKTGVQPFVNTLSTSSSDSETQRHSLILLERLKEWRTRTSQ